MITKLKDRIRTWWMSWVARVEREKAYERGRRLQELAAQYSIRVSYTDPTDVVVRARGWTGGVTLYPSPDAAI